MSSGKDTRHFHAGKLRKTIGDTIYVSVAESCDTLYVARDGTFTSASRGWTPVRGNLEKDGYRRICIDGRHAVVARVVYEVFVESIPDGMEIDHINTGHAFVQSCNGFRSAQTSGGGHARLRVNRIPLVGRGGEGARSHPTGNMPRIEWTYSLVRGLHVDLLLRSGI